MEYGKKTYVYWNLHKLTFSIMQNQKVVGHSNQLYLNNVENGGETFFPIVDFKVKPRTGRQKVLKDRVKNVHAFVIGEIFSCPEIDGTGTGGYTMNNPFDEEKLDMWTHRVSYNPYKGSHFVARGLQDTVWNPVARASMVALTNYQGKPLIQSKNNVMIPHNYI